MAMVQLVGLAKTLATGQTYRPGENEKVDFGRGGASDGNAEYSQLSRTR